MRTDFIPWPGSGSWRPKVGQPYDIPGIGNLGSYSGNAVSEAAGYVVYYIGPLFVSVLPFAVAFSVLLFFIDWTLDKLIDRLPGNGIEPGVEYADFEGGTFVSKNGKRIRTRR